MLLNLILSFLFIFFLFESLISFYFDFRYLIISSYVTIFTTYDIFSSFSKCLPLDFSTVKYRIYHQIYKIDLDNKNSG